MLGAAQSTLTPTHCSGHPSNCSARAPHPRRPGRHVKGVRARGYNNGRGAVKIIGISKRSRSSHARQLKSLQAAAPRLGVKLFPVALKGRGDFGRVYSVIEKERPGGLVVFVGSIFGKNRDRIIKFAAKNRLPAIYAYDSWTRAGGLLSYGPDQFAIYRRMAEYVDKILKGAKPADLPVERPTKFNFVVNLNIAKALGITVPPSILLRATKVIE